MERGLLYVDATPANARSVPVRQRRPCPPGQSTSSSTSLRCASKSNESSPPWNRSRARSRQRHRCRRAATPGYHRPPRNLGQRPECPRPRPRTRQCCRAQIACRRAGRRDATEPRPHRIGDRRRRALRRPHRKGQMMIDPTPLAGPNTASLPYRDNVGAALFNREGPHLHRPAAPTRRPAWAGSCRKAVSTPREDPRGAVLRELREETGTDRAEILAEHPRVAELRFPGRTARPRAGRPLSGPAPKMVSPCGLSERTPTSSSISIPHPEFDAWRWAHFVGGSVSCRRVQAADLRRHCGVFRSLCRDGGPIDGATFRSDIVTKRACRRCGPVNREK